MSESTFACPDLKNNGRQKLLFLGETGNGKSALCNALSQPVKKDGGHLCQNFPESSNQRIGNTETILQHVDFLGISGKEISLIDTVGFNSTEMNNTAIAELIVSLKESCDYINLFAIVVASPKRIEASLQETIKLFVGMFGEERFWQNTVLIFTNLQQSDDQISRRSRTNSDPDQKLIRDFNAIIRETFNLQRDVPTLIIDAHYDGSKLDERNRFTSSACELYGMLMESGGMSVDDVQTVVGKYEGLQEEVNRRTKDADEARRQAENERRAADEARMQAENERIAADEARMQAENERRAADEARRQAENERRAKEEARMQAEKERKAKEEARRQAEKERKAKEEARRRADNMKKIAVGLACTLALGVGATVAGPAGLSAAVAAGKSTAAAASAGVGSDGVALTLGAVCATVFAGGATKDYNKGL